ncbi:hypothetical protein [Streptomyces xiamenensis]|uniref:hypothetical protein n=1 Tax=Streptomyces xiamenensis TaxID=408015 RepID=UPI0035E0730D
MYRIAIVRKGQLAERRICTGDELQEVVYALIRSQGSTIGDGDHAGLSRVIGAARSLADGEGFAALEFGSGAVTIRPHSNESHSNE